MSMWGRLALGWFRSPAPILGLLLGCGSSGGTPTPGSAGTSSSAGSGASTGGSLASAGAGALAGSGGGNGGSDPGNVGGMTAGMAGESSLGFPADIVCNEKRVTIVGELDGAPLEIIHPTRTFSIGPGGVQVDFGLSSFGTDAFVSGLWQFGTFLNEIPDGEPSPLGTARLRLEAPDPRSGIELCADGAAIGRRSKPDSQMGYVMTRLVPLVCPGTPVEGSLTIDERLHGTVDGRALDAPVSSNSDQKGAQFVASPQAVLPLVTDDATGTALSGQVTGGRVELLEAPNVTGDIYCVGQAQFARPTPGAFNVTLSGLSKIGSCRTSPSIGRATVCVQGDPL